MTPAAIVTVTFLHAQGAHLPPAPVTLPMDVRATPSSAAPSDREVCRVATEFVLAALVERLTQGPASWTASVTCEVRREG